MISQTVQIFIGVLGNQFFKLFINLIIYELIKILMISNLKKKKRWLLVGLTIILFNLKKSSMLPNLLNTS